MKKPGIARQNLVPLLFIVLLALALWCMLNGSRAKADPQIFIGGFTTITNGTAYNTNGLTAYQFNQQLQDGLLYHSQLLTLTDFQAVAYSSVQPNSTNGSKILGTWFPTTTNAGYERISGASFIPTNYVYVFIIVGTNPVSFNGQYGN